MSDRACKSDSHRGFEGACPGVALRSSNPEGTTEGGVPVLTVTEIRATAIARGRAIKRVNAWTAVLCGGLPAPALGILFPTKLPQWLAGFGVGLLWASLFEYAYHRLLLHLPGTGFARRHLEHHATVETPTEAEHVNFGSSPIWVVALFAIYFIIVEEVHWRIHIGEWLPPVLRASRAYHLAHHARPDTRFNIFLPLWDTLLGPAGK